MCGDRQWTDAEIAEAMSALGDSGWHSSVMRDGGNPDRLRGVEPFSVTFDEASPGECSGPALAPRRSLFNEHVYLPHDPGLVKYIVSARIYDELVSCGHPTDNFIRADPVRKVQPSAAPPVVRPGRRRVRTSTVEGRGQYVYPDTYEACEWDTDGDGNCAFHSDCASRTFRTGR